MNVVPPADMDGGQVQDVIVGGRIDPAPVRVVAPLVLEDLGQPGGPLMPQRIAQHRPDPVHVVEYLLSAHPGRPHGRDVAGGKCRR